MANYFQATLYPLMARSEGGCAGCHGPESGRLLTMGPTGTDTFYRLRAGGYLVQNVANSLLDRVSRTDETAMPQGGPYWTQRELDETACFVEQLAFFESEADAPADESFPPELLEPYTGPASAEYDNTILTYEQLKGRIAVQFGDDWVRDGWIRLQKTSACLEGWTLRPPLCPIGSRRRIICWGWICSPPMSAARRWL